MSASTEARPLEVLVAERVLGWSVYPEPLWTSQPLDDRVWFSRDVEGWMTRDPEAGAPLHRQRLDACLRSWSGLGLVVEAMREKGWRLSPLEEMRTPPAPHGWKVSFHRTAHPLLPAANADTPWAAAFVAALRALGVDEDTIKRAVEVSDGKEGAP